MIDAPGTKAHRAATGRSWQDDGPVLRNSRQAMVDPHHWGILETVVWIATRDTRSVAGALFWAQHGDPSRLARSQEARGINEQIVLETLLPGDVSGHADACPTSKDDVPCRCEEIGRIRFCHCPDSAQSWGITCSCTEEAKRALLAAIHLGFPIFGVRDGSGEYIAIPRAAFAGLSYFYDANGVGLLSSFSRIRFAVDEVKKRWPAHGLNSVEAADAVDPLSSASESPMTKEQEALTIFIERARQGFTKWPAADEARRIAKEASTAKNDESITKWIRPFYRGLMKNKALDREAVAAVTSQLEAKMAADRAIKRNPD